jgi:hypothetical protein
MMHWCHRNHPSNAREKMQNSNSFLYQFFDNDFTDCAKMGCGPSKHTLQTVDDSVHVMLKHDKKVQQKKGLAPNGYVPRPEHPLMTPQTKPIVAAEEADDVVIPENGK